MNGLHNLTNKLNQKSMKKLSLKKTTDTGTVLTRTQLKNVMGGNPMVTTKVCGIKISGQWYSVAGGRAEAEGALGTTGSWNNGTVTGTVTNWCCDSCSWNVPD